MVKTFNWELCDHQWNNFKRWVDCFDKPFVTITDLKRMIACCDALKNKEDEVVINAIFEGEK